MGALEEQVQKLSSVVQALEARIKSLEERKFSKSPEEVRMILIGPPGAGMCVAHRWLVPNS